MGKGVDGFGEFVWRNCPPFHCLYHSSPSPQTEHFKRQSLNKPRTDWLIVWLAVQEFVRHHELARSLQPDYERGVGVRGPLERIPEEPLHTPRAPDRQEDEDEQAGGDGQTWVFDKFGPKLEILLSLWQLSC